MADTLRSRLIRLAYENPAMRPAVLGLVGKTAGRHERGLSDRTLDWLVEGAAESAELDNARDAEATPKLKQLASKFEDDVERALEAWVKKNDDLLADGITADDLLDDGAAYLVLMTLRGEGVGVWDGDWDHYFDGDRAMDQLQDYLIRKLGKWADDSGTGILNDALEEAAFETTGSMDKYGSSHHASFGFAHRPLMEAKAAIEAGDKRLAQELMAKAGKAISSLSSSKAVRAYDFFEKLEQSMARMASRQAFGEKMSDATEKQFNDALAKAGWPKARHIPGGKRVMDVEYKDRGTLVAQKTIIYSRGKVSQTSYLVNRDYL